MIILVNNNRMSGFAEKIFSDWAYEIETGERESERLFSEVYYDDDPIDCLVTLQRAYSDFCDYFEERLFNKATERAERHQARQEFESAAGGGRNFERSLKTWRRNFEKRSKDLKSVTAEQFMEMAKNGKLPSNIQSQYNNLINKFGLSHDVVSAALSENKDTKNAALNSAKLKMNADRLAGTQAAADVHVKYMNPYQGSQEKFRTDGHGGVISLKRNSKTGNVELNNISERNLQKARTDINGLKQVVSANQDSDSGTKRQERIDKERETRQKRQEAKINEVLNKDPSKRTQAEERRVNEYLKQQEYKKQSNRRHGRNRKNPSGQTFINERSGGSANQQFIGNAATLSDQEALAATRDKLYKGDLGTTSKSNTKFEMKLANSDSPAAKKALEDVSERREVAKAANKAMVDKEREAAANAQADVEKMVAEERAKANAAAKASTASTPAPKPQTNPTRRTPSGGGGGGGRSASTAANVAKGEAEGWFKRNRRKLGLAAAALGTLGGGYAAYQHYKDRD